MTSKFNCASSSNTQSFENKLLCAIQHFNSRIRDICGSNETSGFLYSPCYFFADKTLRTFSSAKSSPRNHLREIISAKSIPRNRLRTFLSALVLARLFVRPFLHFPFHSILCVTIHSTNRSIFLEHSQHIVYVTRHCFPLSRSSLLTVSCVFVSCVFVSFVSLSCTCVLGKKKKTYKTV